MFVFTYTAALLSVVLLSFAAVLVIKKKKSLLVWLLVFHIISDVIWVASNAAADISKTPSTLIFWSGMAFVGASFLVSFFLLFVDYFISEVKPSFTKVFLFCAPSIVFSALAFSDFSVIDTF